ncbi:hypothetical protein ACLB2K_036299 [Fragaria x ananassa]
MLLCHRFYARQSHAKNGWHTVASACVLLASKVQGTPRALKDVVHVVYGREIEDRIAEMAKKYKIKNPHDVRECDKVTKTTSTSSWSSTPKGSTRRRRCRTSGTPSPSTIKTATDKLTEANTILIGIRG